MARPLILAAIAVTVFTAALAGGHWIMTAMNNDSAPPASPRPVEAPMPKLVVALGDDLLDVKKKSTFAFATKGLVVDHLLIFDRPKAFTYDHPRLQFTLPETLFFAMKTYFGHVVYLTTSPQLKVTDLDETMALADQVIATLEQAGWRRDPDRDWYSTTEEFRRDWGTPRFKTPVLGYWRDGDTKIYIQAKLVRRRGEKRTPTATWWFIPSPRRSEEIVPHDEFLLTVYISNRALWSEWNEKLDQAMEAAGHPIGDSIPLQELRPEYGR